MLSLNPYIAGNPVGGTPNFIGRADVLREVFRVLRHSNPNAIVLYGQRRIGKTSILQQLAEQLSNEGPFHSVYFDLQDKATWPLGRVLVEIAHTITYSLNLPAPDLGNDPALEFRSGWLPALLKDFPSSPKKQIEVTDRQGGTGKAPTPPQPPTSLVLLFDEFDVLADPKGGQAGADLFPYLRQLMTLDPAQLKFVFVIGRKIEDLESIALSLFKGTPALRVSLLDYEATIQLVHISEQNETLHWSPKAFEKVWELTHGHPFLTQQLCWWIWENLHNEDPSLAPTVMPEDVEEATKKTLESSRNTMEWIWGGLPPAERIVISALAKMGKEPITQDQLVQVLRESGVRVVIRELQNAPQLLQDWDLLELADEGFQFRVELLRQWLLKHKPLNRVWEELDRLNPLAESLYQAAMAYYSEGKIDLAENQVRQAMATNPNHIRANELIADILISKEEIDEAIKVLELLYSTQPAIARPRLIQVLLLKAGGTADDDARLEIIQKILDINPKDPDAKRYYKDIWKKLGDRAVDKGNLEEALIAYEKAELTSQYHEIKKLIRRKDLRILSNSQLDNSVSEKEYKDSLLVLEKISSKYLEDDEFQERKNKTFGKLMQEYITAGVTQINSLEFEKKYLDALELTAKFSNDFPTHYDWQSIIERLRRKTRISDLYYQGQSALANNNRNKAIEFFSEVIGIDPEYLDTIALLHKAQAGVNVIELSLKLMITIVGLLSCLLIISILIGRIYTNNSIALFATNISVGQTQTVLFYSPTPSQTPSPTITPSPTNTLTPTPTSTLVPTPTKTLVPISVDCEMVFTSNSSRTIYADTQNLELVIGNSNPFDVVWELQDSSIGCDQVDLTSITFELIKLGDESNIFEPTQNIFQLEQQNETQDYLLNIRFVVGISNKDEFPLSGNGNGTAKWQLVYKYIDGSQSVATFLSFEFIYSTNLPTPTPIIPLVNIAARYNLGTAPFTTNFGFDFKNVTICEVDYGDGTPIESLPCELNVKREHTFVNQGQYTVLITGSGRHGNKSNSLVVTVNKP